jgi:hypothetical protein
LFFSCCTSGALQRGHEPKSALDGSIFLVEVVVCGLVSCDFFGKAHHPNQT